MRSLPAFQHGNRHPFCDLFVGLLVTGNHVTAHLRVDKSGIDCIHADAVLDVFQGGRARQAKDAVLGCEYEPMPGFPVNAPTEALLTMAPPLPCRSICCSSCFMQLQTPRRLIPITRSHYQRIAPNPYHA